LKTARKLLYAATIAVSGCSRSDVKISGPLPQRGYIWQQEWTPAVIESLGEAARRMDGVILLGAEISFAGNNPQIAKASIDWKAVKREADHCSIALRVAPFAGPFRGDDAPARMIVDLTKQLLHEVRAYDQRRNVIGICPGRRNFVSWYGIACQWQQWVAKAARFGVPFSVALPTYRCTAGYRPDGKLLSVAMDSVQPSWPPQLALVNSIGSDGGTIS
jgi:hypothetical protein